ncbi:cRISPR-associated protein CXXC-CXXC region [Ruminococcus sp. CAG:624]|nr:cRISPR-associated protein CXXC-CXXC region [Ruminococcus sp. CAG:624]
MLENCLKTELGSSFMLNAGICGFIRFMEHNNAEKGKDYDYQGQSLFIDIDYLKNNDISEMYISTMSEIFEENTKHFRTLNEKHEIDKLNSIGIDNLDDKQKKRITELYKNFADLLVKSSYLSAYEMLSDVDNITTINKDIIEDLKKESDLSVKHEKYNNIYQIINQKKIKDSLIYTDLLYDYFKLFFSENSQSHKITRLCEKNKKYSDTFKNNFISPLFDEMDIPQKKKSAICIECLGTMSATEVQKKKRRLTFLFDIADDLDRKKSYYWFCKPDAYVCPLCNFIYAFIPLGFAFIGSEAVFINSNSTIETLIKIMSAQCEKIFETSNLSVRKRIMRTFTEEKIDALEKTNSNIQIILRSSNFSHFVFDVIDKDMIRNLKKGSKYLSMLEKKWVTFDSKKFISVYDNIFDMILNKHSLYPFIDKALKNEIDKSNNINYLKGVLRLEIIFNGGTSMDELNKKIDFAFMSGKALRESILGKEAAKSSENGAEADDNRLRGLVYRLVNLTAVGDCSQFIDTVIRIYAGYGLTIPTVFKDCYKSDEMFKAISHGFILGLKYAAYEKNNDKQED